MVIPRARRFQRSKICSLCIMTLRQQCVCVCVLSWFPVWFSFVSTVAHSHGKWWRLLRSVDEWEASCHVIYRHIWCERLQTHRTRDAGDWCGLHHEKGFHRKGVFMRKHYQQVADEQFEFETLKAEDSEEGGGWIIWESWFKSTNSFIFTVTYLPVLPAHTTCINTYMTHIHLSTIWLQERRLVWVKSSTLVRLKTSFWRQWTPVKFDPNFQETCFPMRYDI